MSWKQSKKRLRLVLEHVTLRTPGFSSVKGAYKKHPVEFLELYQEMSRVLDQAQRSKKETRPKELKDFYNDAGQYELWAPWEV